LKIVRDAAGKLADAFHLLGLALGSSSRF